MPSIGMGSRTWGLFVLSLGSVVCEVCEDQGFVDLRIDLYSGNVRDEDTFSDSDAYCELSVGGLTKESAVALETETPTFEEFFLFGCQKIGSQVSLICYDWDPDFIVVDRDELVFSTATVHWPESGVKVRWTDTYDDQYYIDIDFTYEVPAPTASPSSANPSTESPTKPPTARPPVKTSKDDDDGTDAAAAATFFAVATLCIGLFIGGSVVAWKMRQKTDGPMTAEVTEVGGVELAEVVAVTSVEVAAVEADADGEGLATAKSMV